MDIPFGIFVMYSTIALNIGILGIWLGVSKRMDGAPFITVFAGFMFLLPIILIENIDMAYLEGDAEDMIYDVPTNTLTANLNSATPIRAEYPALTSSVLLDKEFDCIEIPLQKVNSPPVGTPVIIGIFDDTMTIVKEFDRMNVTSMSTGFFFYDVCLPEGETYTIGSLENDNQRIGAMYNDGDSTNRILIRADGNNPFDDVNTVLTTWSGGSFVDSSGSDLSMKLYHSSQDSDTVQYAFNQNDIWVFSIMLGILFLFTGIMIQFAKLP